jgi:hypothetical protein
MARLPINSEIANSNEVTYENSNIPVYSEVDKTINKSNNEIESGAIYDTIEEKAYANL